MDRRKEFELFAGLARGTPRLKDWAQEKLSAELDILLQAPDVDRLKQAQGAARVYQGLLKLLDESLRASQQ